MLSRHARDALMLGLGAAVWPAAAFAAWAFLNRPPFHN